MKKTILLFIAFFLVCNGLFLYANIPIIFTSRHHPTGTFYTMTHQGIMDYYLYISYIRDSMAGSWMTRNFYSGAQTQTSFFYVYFIILGKIASVFHLSQFMGYHVGRLISLELLIFGIFLVCRETLGGKWGVIAAFLAVFSTIPPIRAFPKIAGEYIDFSYWYYMNPPGKLDFLPHHAIGLAILFWTIFFLIRFIKHRSNNPAIFMFLGASLTGIFFPPAGLVVVFVTSLSVLIVLIHLLIRKKPIDIKRFYPFLAIVGMGIISLGIMKFQTMLGFPWSQWKDWDMYIWNDLKNTNALILISGGYMLLFSLPAIVYQVYKGNNMKFLFIAVWGLLPYVLIPFTNLLGIGRIRVIFMGNYVALSILTVMMIRKLAAYPKNKILSKAIYGLFIAAFTLLAYPETKYQAENIVANKYVVFFNTTILSNMMKSYQYMNGNVPKNSVFVGTGFMSNMIPAFAPMNVYCGHETQTKNYWEKTQVINRFYQGDMSPTEALGFLKDNKIGYIYFGPMEWHYGWNIAKYSLHLEKIYDEDGVTIHKVI